MSNLPAKKSTPSLADRLKDKDETPKEETPLKNNDELSSPDELNSTPEWVGERPRSSGVDGSDSTEYITNEAGVLVDKSKYDTQGNGVTDNYPIGYVEEQPAHASTFSVPSENAIIRHTVAESVYATPAEIDDKGLGINVDGVTSVNPKTGEVLTDDSNKDSDDK